MALEKEKCTKMQPLLSAYGVWCAITLWSCISQLISKGNLFFQIEALQFRGGDLLFSIPKAWNWEIDTKVPTDVHSQSFVQLKIIHAMDT